MTDDWQTWQYTAVCMQHGCEWTTVRATRAGANLALTLHERVSHSGNAPIVGIDGK